MKQFFLFTYSLVLAACPGCNNQGANENQPAKADTADKTKDTSALLPAALLPQDTTIKQISVTKNIYLTFDDGPLLGSENIDKIVRDEQVDVNVFIVGKHEMSDTQMQSYYRLYQTNPYVEIGNHSFTHANDHYKKFYQNPDAVVTDFMKCQDELQIPNKFARQPGRNQWRLNGITRNDISSGSKSADMLYRQGFKVFGWDVEWQHMAKTGAPVQTPDQMVKTIGQLLANNSTVKPGNVVVLIHDEMFQTSREAAELKQLIDELKAKSNYHFEHLSKYPG